MADVTREVLADGFGRIAEGVPLVVEGLSTEQLLWRPDAEANHLAWLVWHLSRQQDAQLAALADLDPAWAAWHDRFGLPYPRAAHGYGMSSGDVGDFTLEDPALLVGYHADVHRLTLDALDIVVPDRLSTVIDESWDPPVTAATRIVSVLDDAAKHLGQAEYLRGLLQRR